MTVLVFLGSGELTNYYFIVLKFLGNPVVQMPASFFIVFHFTSINKVYSYVVSNQFTIENKNFFIEFTINKK